VTVTWTWLPFDRLTTRQLYDVLRLRQRVFVVEQNCPFLEADGVDLKCWHGLGTDDAGTLLATARIVPPGLKTPEPAIGRVVTAPEARRTGLGRELMQEAIAQTRRLYPGQPIYLGGQRYLERFYRSLGFEPFGEPYEEDGIPHLHMRREA